MLSYEQSLDGLSQVVKVLYQLTATCAAGSAGWSAEQF